MENQAAACVTTDPEVTAELDSPPEVVATRTRSGRRVRTPAPLADSQAPPPPSPAKPSTRRTTRKAALPTPREESEEDSTTTTTPPPSSSAVAAVSEPTTSTTTTSPGSPESQQTEEGRTEATPGTMETAPLRPGQRSQEEVLFVPGTKHTAPIPLGKPKSGRVWKDRNKQRWVLSLPINHLLSVTKSPLLLSLKVPY